MSHRPSVQTVKGVDLSEPGSGAVQLFAGLKTSLRSQGRPAHGKRTGMTGGSSAWMKMGPHSPNRPFNPDCNPHSIVAPRGGPG